METEGQETGRDGAAPIATGAGGWATDLIGS